MSKYIDLELALNELLRLYEEDCDSWSKGDKTVVCFQYGRAKEALNNIPTIEVSEDCISREQVRAKLDYISYAERDPITIAKRIVDDAPSVVPTCQKNRQVERAEGEWIVNEDLPKLDNTFVIDCSICGKGMFAHYNDDYPNYCYNCGAKMRCQ